MACAALRGTSSIGSGHRAAVGDDFTERREGAWSCGRMPSAPRNWISV